MKLSSLLITSGAVVLASAPLTIAQAKTTTLESIKAPSAITIDGVAESVWDSAPAVKMKLNKLPYKPNNGYPGIKKTTVEMKSVYDSEYIYFLITYKDPTESMERYPWIKQADGTWKDMVKKDSTGHENTYYEDKFAILWDINADNFAKKGCNAACHRAKDGKIDGKPSKSPARKYTKEGQTIDMWHWKGVRTNPNGQLDDQYIDSNTDAKKNKGWGRKGDHKTSGGYGYNKKDGQPEFISANMTATSPAILDAEKMPIPKGFDKFDRIPNLVTAPFTGSRGDIATVGVWKDGVWTLEMKRKLITTGEKATIQDVQFDDMDKVYPFGIAVFDNTQINHIYHRGVMALEFK